MAKKYVQSIIVLTLLIFSLILQSCDQLAYCVAPESDTKLNLEAGALVNCDVLASAYPLRKDISAFTFQYSTEKTDNGIELFEKNYLTTYGEIITTTWVNAAGQSPTAVYTIEPKESSYKLPLGFELDQTTGTLIIRKVLEKFDNTNIAYEFIITAKGIGDYKGIVTKTIKIQIFENSLNAVTMNTDNGVVVIEGNTDQSSNAVILSNLNENVEKIMVYDGTKVIFKLFKNIKEITSDPNLVINKNTGVITLKSSAPTTINGDYTIRVLPGSNSTFIGLKEKIINIKVYSKNRSANEYIKLTSSNGTPIYSEETENYKYDNNGSEVQGTKWGCVLDSKNRMWEVKDQNDYIFTRYIRAYNKAFRWGGTGALPGAKVTLANGTLVNESYFADWNELIAAVNDAKLCGKTNWRVPTITEFEELRQPTGGYASFFPDVDKTTNSSSYWTIDFQNDKAINKSGAPVIAFDFTTSPPAKVYQASYFIGRVMLISSP